MIDCAENDYLSRACVIPAIPRPVQDGQGVDAVTSWEIVFLEVVLEYCTTTVLTTGAVKDLVQSRKVK